ncbi:MAG: recombinase family protein [Chloroflexi bacterium]|nr:recombinase family protein [Chloroflexota bacterium]
MSPPEAVVHPKISSAHLQRLAYVYVRQSTMKQVEHNRESQLNQYRLVERAQALGWPADRTRVIDSDLGQSGQSSQHRSGFNDLLAEVTLSHVGIVLSYEVSRLARNNSDWYRLLDLAAVFGTLIADSDGVYDPRQYNDRLLLGLKGAMSEAELHILRARLDAGRLSQVRRGQYVQHLPTGLLRLADGRVVKDPDEQIRGTLDLVFAKFAELGSCGRVVRYCRDHEILLPRRQVAGVFAGELFWKPATDSTVLEMVQNPAYAGAFAYGRRQGDPARRKPGLPATGNVRIPLEEWVHLQQDVYPAYISWDTYMSNQARLRQNGLRYREQKEAARGAPRAGAALLQGLVICGMCGHHMNVIYKPTQRYVCDDMSRHLGAKMCMSLDGVSLDAVVTQAFFEALCPAQLDVLDAVLAGQRAERDQLETQWRQKLARADYEAHLAERQYNAVDPDNRLVAATLEARWEAKLKQARTMHEAHERFLRTLPPPQITPELREQFQHISKRLPELWETGRLTSTQKKELLQCLIAQVILNRRATDDLEARIVWVSGQCTMVHARPRCIHRAADVSNYAELVEQIHQLCGEGLNDDQMAAQLTREGFCSARADGVSACSVRKIRLARGWFLLSYVKHEMDQVDGQWTTLGLAKQLGLSQNYILHCIYDETILASHVHRIAKVNGAMYLIDDYPGLCDAIRTRYGRHRTPQDLERHSHG